MIDPTTHASEHLSWRELACHDLARTPYPLVYRADPTRLVALVELFEIVRAVRGLPMLVNSGYRTPEHQLMVRWDEYCVELGRHPTLSDAARDVHVQGRALDVQSPAGMSVSELHRIILEMAQPGGPLRHLLGGLGIYRTFVHVDVRPRVGDHLAQWDNRHIDLTERRD